jgi:hypothetical protein
MAHATCLFASCCRQDYRSIPRNVCYDCDWGGGVSATIHSKFVAGVRTRVKCRYTVSGHQRLSVNHRRIFITQSV